MADLGRMIATKQVSPVEVVRGHLDRIAALDPKLRAFITVCSDAALESARSAEADLMAGRAVGPLHGVPWAPKDLYSTKGVRTTGGSKILADSVPSDDATVVARLTGDREARLIELTAALRSATHRVSLVRTSAMALDRVGPLADHQVVLGPIGTPTRASDPQSRTSPLTTSLSSSGLHRIRLRGR